MFVEACAIISIFMKEGTAAAYRDALRDAEAPFTSPLAAFEAVIILARPDRLNSSYGETLKDVLDWLQLYGVDLREASDPNALLANAVAVAQQHGLGKRALSNFDCFHYAHAKAAGAPLLTLDRLLRETDVETLPQGE